MLLLYGSRLRTRNRSAGREEARLFAGHGRHSSGETPKNRGDRRCHAETGGKVREYSSGGGPQSRQGRFSCHRGNFAHPPAQPLPPGLSVWRQMPMQGPTPGKSAQPIHPICPGPPLVPSEDGENQKKPSVQCHKTPILNAECQLWPMVSENRAIGPPAANPRGAAVCGRSAASGANRRRKSRPENGCKAEPIRQAGRITVTSSEQVGRGYG